MNSCCGVLGSSGCRFFDPRPASSITMRDQEIMRRTRAQIEECGFEVIYGDTDSTIVWPSRADDEVGTGAILAFLGEDFEGVVSRQPDLFGG